MVRVATEKDIGKIISMGRAFFSMTNFAKLFDFDDESFLKTFHALDGANGVCYVCEKEGEIIGISGAIAYPFYLNLSHKTGQELFWWVDPEHRHGRSGILLLRAIEEWAKSIGCKTFSMISMDSIGGEKISSLYKKLGYSSTEHSHIKEL